MLECAWQLFREKGYGHTTVEEITKAADVAKGTFFNYFETKETILGELGAWQIELLGNRVLAADDVPVSAVARIKLVMKAISDEFLPGRGLMRQLFAARIGAPIKHESAHRLGSLMHELVLQGQAGREIRKDVDAGLIARLLMTCVFCSFMQCQYPGEEHRACGSFGLYPDDAFEAGLTKSVDALMDGLGGPEWTRPPSGYSGRG